jgi:hypothetical protein
VPVSAYFGGHGSEVMKEMKEKNGEKAGEREFYATANKRGETADADMKELKRCMDNYNQQATSAARKAGAVMDQSLGQVLGSSPQNSRSFDADMKELKRCADAYFAGDDWSPEARKAAAEARKRGGGREEVDPAIYHAAGSWKGGGKKETKAALHGAELNRKLKNPRELRREGPRVPITSPSHPAYRENLAEERSAERMRKGKMK